jgi:hypothetical protein
MPVRAPRGSRKPKQGANALFSMATRSLYTLACGVAAFELQHACLRSSAAFIGVCPGLIRASTGRGLDERQ